MSDNDEIPEAIAESTFRVGGVEVKCYVLTDGQRVIDADSLCDLLEAMEDGATLTDEDAAALGEFLRGMTTQHPSPGMVNALKESPE